jgi:hypothetical protein
VLGIGAEDLVDEGKEELVGALIRTVKEEGETFAGVTGEGVADGKLKIVLEVGIGIGEQVQEGGPGRGDSVWMVGDGDETGNVVVRVVGLKFESGEVEGAVKDGDEVGVGVEGVWEQGDARKGAGEGEERFEVERGLAVLGMFEETGTEDGIGIRERLGGLIIGLEGGVGEGEDLVGGVELPVGAGVEKPAEGGDIADLMAELGDEVAGVAEVGEVVGVEGTEALDERVGGCDLLWCCG